MNAATRLAQDQQTLLRAVLGGQGDVALRALVDSNPSNASNPLLGAAEKALARRGLQAYQSHGLALAERAQSAAYPVIAQLLGKVARARAVQAAHARAIQPADAVAS